MSQRGELLDAVEARFAVTGRDTPGWPDPHPDRRPTTDEAEYSRLLDPAKFRIIPARLRAWADVLVERAGVVVQEVEPHDLDLGEVAPLARRVQVWRPPDPAALPLVVASWPIEGVDDGVVALGAGAPPRWVEERLPDCGCDACDCGSVDLLEHLDGTVEHVVTGAFVHLTTRTGRLWTTADGGRRGVGDVDLHLLDHVDDPGRLPPGAVVVSGVSWL